MAVRQSPEQGRTSHQNNSTTSCRCAEREQGGTGGSSVPPRPQTAAGLPGCRQHGCHFVEEKKTRIGSTGCGVSFEKGGQIKPLTDTFYTSFPNLTGPRGEGVRVSNSGNNLGFILVRFAPCFSWRVRDNQHRAAPTWPDSSDC